MARSRRGSFRGRRPRLDWVQNPVTYSELYTNITTEQNNAVAGVLVHSSQVRRFSIGTGIVPTEVLMGAAFPDVNAKQVVRAVRGTIECIPDESWSSTAVRQFGFRIAKFVQDPGSQLPQVPIDYNMYGFLPTPPAGTENEPYVFADDPFQWERRMNWAFNDQQPSPIFTIPVRWSGKVYLEADECFAVYVEGDGALGGSGILQCRFWLRSLVEVPRA